MDSSPKRAPKRGASSKETTKPAKKQKRDRTPTSPAGPEEEEAPSILADILALGGDEEDLALVGEPGSSSDEHITEDTQTHDRHLETELAAVVKQLGFQPLPRTKAATTAVPPSKGENRNGRPRDEVAPAKESRPAKVEHHLNAGRHEELSPARESRPAKAGLIFAPRPDWHAAVPPSPATDDTAATGLPNKSRSSQIHTLMPYAQQLLGQDAERFSLISSSAASRTFLSTVMRSGTLSDKVSALALAVQESPVHNIRAFESLISLASRKSRTQAVGALGAVVDLLGPGSVLPPTRRLRTFETQPDLLAALQQHPDSACKPDEPPAGVTKEGLISWAFEHWLKGVYFTIIQLLEAWCSDVLEYSRLRGVDFVFALLREKPEQEANLLRLLVNKLKDKERRVASRASYLLLQLQESHPGMKSVIIHAIEKELLLDPALGSRPGYYAANTLNQTVLSGGEPLISKHVIRIYFELFLALLKSGQLGVGSESGRDQAQAPHGNDKNSTSTESTDKLVSAILTGINRAIPFVQADDTELRSHIDTLFRVSHSANFNTGIQSLLLIQRLCGTMDIGTDRFYRTLYESLLDPRLASSSKHALYLNLLLRAIKNDVDANRVKAFCKRMLQIIHLHQPPFACGLLYVVSQAGLAFPGLRALLDQPEDHDEDPAEADHISPSGASTSLHDTATSKYNGRKRDPKHSNAHKSCLWEIAPLSDHFHPSVVACVASLTSDSGPVPKPDLEKQTLMRFLDRLAFKAPKTSSVPRGGSIMQPPKIVDDQFDTWLGGRQTAGAGSVTSASFRNMSSHDVTAEDAFFHRYFAQTHSKPKTGDPRQPAADGEEEDAHEDEILQALGTAEDSQQEDDDDDSSLDEGLLDLLEDSDGSAHSAPGSTSDPEEEGSDIWAGDDSEVDGETMDLADKGVPALSKLDRRSVRNLPMFADADDYERLLANEEE